jgi:hypothetical protein
MADRDELFERLVSLVPGKAVEPAAFAALAAVGERSPNGAVCGSRRMA